MNAIQIIATEDMIKVAKNREHKIVIGLVLDMLTNLDAKRYAVMTPGQRREYLRGYFEQMGLEKN